MKKFNSLIEKHKMTSALSRLTALRTDRPDCFVITIRKDEFLHEIKTKYQDFFEDGKWKRKRIKTFVSCEDILNAKTFIRHTKKTDEFIDGMNELNMQPNTVKLSDFFEEGFECVWLDTEQTDFQIIPTTGINTHFEYGLLFKKPKDAIKHGESLLMKKISEVESRIQHLKNKKTKMQKRLGVTND